MKKTQEEKQRETHHKHCLKVAAKSLLETLVSDLKLEFFADEVQEADNASTIPEPACTFSEHEKLHFAMDKEIFQALVEVLYFFGPNDRLFRDLFLDHLAVWKKLGGGERSKTVRDALND